MSTFLVDGFPRALEVQKSDLWEAFADALRQVNYFFLSRDESFFFFFLTLQSSFYCLLPYKDFFRAIMGSLLFTCGFFHWSYLKEIKGHDNSEHLTW